MSWEQDWDRAEAQREARRAEAARAWQSSRPLTDSELDDLADDVDRRYAGDLQVLGDDGTVRPLTNLEMLASSRKWKKLNNEARAYQRFVIAVEEWIDAGCPFAIGASDEYSYDDSVSV